MTTTFNEVVTLEKITCGTCGVVFAIPQSMIETLKRESGGFYCPNGHQRGWWKSESDKLKEAIEQKERELRASKCETLNEQNRRFAAESDKEKAEKKLRQVSKGVCTCCNRTFQNLQRHMQTRHKGKA